MIYSLSVPPYQLKEINQYNCSYQDYPEYPLCLVDRESYVCSATIENSDEGQVQSGKVIHNLQIGRYCSLALDVYFLIGRGKDYFRVTTSPAKVFHETANVDHKYREKGSIILQNDVWVGRKASFMPGVTVHNGAIVGALAHVVKDVPPYAIVGGNPARIIGYRFDPDIINQLQTIQWWYWTEEKIRQNAKYFNNDIKGFCERFYDEAKEEVERIRSLKPQTKKDRYLMVLDCNDNYSVTPDVLNEFVRKNNADSTKELILFLADQSDNHMAEMMHRIVNQTQNSKAVHCSFVWKKGRVDEIKELLPSVRHIIINRAPETVQVMCYAELYGENIEIISGVDQTF